MGLDNPKQPIADTGCDFKAVAATLSDRCLSNKILEVPEGTPEHGILLAEASRRAPKRPLVLSKR